MPIHVRANMGDYAEACLLPGDPLRAKHIAETFMEDVVQRNSERGMLGYTGTFKGRPVSVQSSGMGCPSAAIVIEELVQLGVTKLLRVGTCGGLQPDLSMGDLIIALSATPADSTASHYVGGEPHAPTADFGLVHEAVHQAKHLGKPVRVGPIVSSDIFYQPDPGLAGRWSDRGILAVEMEAAVLFTLGALRKVQAGCMLIVSDVIVEGEFLRISDEDMKKAVDEMTELAHKAAGVGLEGDALLSERRGHLGELAREAALAGSRLLVVVGGDGSINEVVNGLAGIESPPAVALIPRGTGGDFVRTFAIPSDIAAAARVALTGDTRSIDLGRVDYRSWDGADGSALFANVASAGMSGAIAQRANDTSKALGAKASYLWATFAVFAGWSAVETRLTVDGESRSGRMFDVVVANGRYFGGGM